MDVILYTRQNCTLCDEAKRRLRDAGYTPREVDVDTDPELKRKYTNDVPVVFIDGAETFRHRVTADGLDALNRGWVVAEKHHLQKEFRFDDFASALAFANKVGAIADEINHHPDLLVGWGKVRVMTWSHDSKAITGRDYKLAGRIDEIK